LYKFNIASYINFLFYRDTFVGVTPIDDGTSEKIPEEEECEDEEEEEEEEGAVEGILPAGVRETGSCRT